MKRIAHGLQTLGQGLLAGIIFLLTWWISTARELYEGHLGPNAQGLTTAAAVAMMMTAILAIATIWCLATAQPTPFMYTTSAATGVVYLVGAFFQGAFQYHYG